MAKNQSAGGSPLGLDMRRSDGLSMGLRQNASRLNKPKQSRRRGTRRQPRIYTVDRHEKGQQRRRKLRSGEQLWQKKAEFCDPADHKRLGAVDLRAH
jgi:hypothetical protein